jgi:hypothetical protein
MTSLLVIGHQFHYYSQGRVDASQRPLYLALEDTFDNVKVHFVEDSWPRSMKEIGDYQNYDVCMWFVLFRMLIEQPPFDWADYRGLRLMHDRDAHANFHNMLGNRYFGRFTEVFHRDEFHYLICTGKRTRNAMEAEGVPSFWLPKAYDPQYICNKNGDRRGIGYFGNIYDSRGAMLRYLSRKRIPYEHFTCTYDELSDHLNRFAGCLICNMGAQRKGFVSKAINRLFPGHGIGLNPGVEPMLKNFEVCGAGCAPIMDWIDEFEDLGFREAENMVSYHSFPELADKLEYYLDREDQLFDIGRKACELVQQRHTWHHRALELKVFIDQLSQSSGAVG